MGIRDEGTISRYGRGTCSVCGGTFRLLKNGMVGRHGDKATWPPKNCAGYGQQPKEG